METETPFTLGTHSAQLAFLVKSQASMQVDITQIKETLAERRGERRSVKAVSAAVSFLVALISSIVAFATTHLGSTR